jgi:hypothetical protein
VAQPGDGAHAVEERHVQVDDDRIRLVAVDELERGDAVRHGAGDGELGLPLDEFGQGRQEALVVIDEEHAYLTVVARDRQPADCAFGAGARLARFAHA